MQGYKGFTHDFRSPIRGGPPVFDGTTPYQLPRVEVDRGPAECAAGWNFSRTLAGALQIAGLWPMGRPSVAFVVEDDEGIERGDKCRGPAPLIQRAVGEDEIADAILEMSVSFGVHQIRMAESQAAWRRALARPDRQPQIIPALLAQALTRRKLNWVLKLFNNDRTIRAALAARDARAARDAWAARAARAARDAWAARAARDARAAWAAWDARAAWAALTVEYAALAGWIEHEPELLTVGLRDAYQAGLETAFPVTGNILGWCLA